MIISVADTGAQADAGAPQTAQMQKAIDAVFAAGGGEVQVPAGTFLTGGLRLRTGVTLRLMQNARVKGVRDPEAYNILSSDAVEPLDKSLLTDALYQRSDYGPDRSFDFVRIAGSRWNNALIRAVNARDIAIIGEPGSVIDGSDCFDELGEEEYRGPHLINMFYCENVRLAGYTTVDSANWAHAIFFSKNIDARNLTCLAGHDGIHVTSCDDVNIQNCVFRTGDDCVAGFDNRRVHVSDCEMNTACSAMRFGGTDALVERCKFFGPADYVFRGSLTRVEKRTGAKPQKTAGHRYNMLSIFTYYADYSITIREQPGNIVIRDCEADNVDRFLHYNYSGNETWQKNRPLKDIAFINMRAANIAMPLTAYGDANVPFELTLQGVDISFREDAAIKSVINACNYSKITLDSVTLTGARPESQVRSWGGDGEIKSDIAGIPPLAHATEPFVCKPI